MKIPLVDLKAQYAAIRTDVDAAIQRVLDSAGFILGAEVRQFEEQYAAYVQASDAVGVASGTAALEMALRACGVGAGDEVITTAHTFIATAEAISHVGAVPVFADIDPATYNLDPEAVEARITPRTRAIVAVHLYGLPAAMDELSDIARRHGIRLIEDAAQAHGAEYHGRRCGSIGDIACFSFYPGKNLGAYGDAGAVTANDADLIAEVRLLRDHGRTTKYEHSVVGLAERLDSLQAAVLGAKLPHLEGWTEARRAHARSYREQLQGVVICPEEPADVRHVYHLFVVRVDRRDDVLAHLAATGISAGVHYPVPLHLQPAYRSLGYAVGDLPHTERAASEVLSLPMYPELTQEQIRYVVEQVSRSVR
jgi:dTDP-4-amino-4,6-dideoxygalactose transaminase